MKWLSNVLLVVVLVGLVALAGFRLVTLASNVPDVVAQVREREETVRPARLNVVVVADGTCKNCTDTKPFLDALQKQRASIVSLKQVDGTTQEGKQYIAQQKLISFPAVLVSGETSRGVELTQFLSQNTTPGDQQLIYFVPAPYHDVASDKVRGLFRATYITTPSCEGCYDVMNNAVALQNLGVNVAEDKVVSNDSTDGKALIQEYKIRYLPTVVLTGDLSVYPAFQEVWPQVGSTEIGGTYILRDGVKLMGTYYDLKLGKAVTPKADKSSP